MNVRKDKLTNLEGFNLAFKLERKSLKVLQEARNP